MNYRALIELGEDMLFIRTDTLIAEPESLQVSVKPKSDGDWALCSAKLEAYIRAGEEICTTDFVIVSLNRLDVFPIRAWLTKETQELSGQK